MDTEGVSEMTDELEARAKVAKRHLDAYEREMAEIRKLLPAIRAEDPRKYGPRRLEGMVLGLIERTTISRMTAEAAGTTRKPAAQS